MNPKIRKEIFLFERYSVSGLTSFVCELVLLYGFIRIFALPYYYAVPLAFLIATLGQFIICHAWVFLRSKRSVRSEFFYFMSILTTGLLLNSAIVSSLVSLLGMNVYVARIISGMFVALWDFYLNARFNFRSRLFKR